MLRRISITLGVLCVLIGGYLYLQALGTQNAPPTGAVQAPSVDSLTIAFGSCNRQTAPQTYWNTIASHRPAAWVWLGDNIYSDTDDMVQMQADYATLKNAAAYTAFVETTPLIYGAWDDHDYGKNDAGKEWPVKEEAKTLLLDFLDVPAAAEVRQHAGTYQAYDIGGVKLLLLDTRYFRDALAPPTKPGDRYGANPDGDILGRNPVGLARRPATQQHRQGSPHR